MASQRHERCQNWRGDQSPRSVFCRLLPPIRVFLWLSLCTLLAACGQGQPATRPAHTETAVPASADTLGPPKTLPPTWTPAPNNTPRPTFTPRPSLTPIPTFTAQQICDHFQILIAPPENSRFDYDAKVPFAWQGVSEDIPVVMTITLHGSMAGLRLSVPTTDMVMFSLPLNRLPGAGQYDWKIWLQHPSAGDICPHSGTFTRNPAPII